MQHVATLAEILIELRQEPRCMQFSWFYSVDQILWSGAAESGRMFMCSER